MKTKKARLRGKADHLLQETIRQEHQFCECCNKPISCGHHFFTKGSCSALRYNFDNIIPVCASCHLKFHSKFSSEMIGETIERRGIEWFNKLKVKRRTLEVKTGIGYYNEIIKELSAKIN